MHQLYSALKMFVVTNQRDYEDYNAQQTINN